MTQINIQVDLQSIFSNPAEMAPVTPRCASGKTPVGNYSVDASAWAMFLKEGEQVIPIIHAVKANRIYDLVTL